MSSSALRVGMTIVTVLVAAFVFAATQRAGDAPLLQIAGGVMIFLLGMSVGKGFP